MVELGLDAQGAEHEFPGEVGVARIKTGDGAPEDLLGPGAFFDAECGVEGDLAGGHYCAVTAA
jgi:hypothetical protein